MKVLVFGGRDFGKKVDLLAEGVGVDHEKELQLGFELLDALHGYYCFTCVVEGGATGADTLAREWANARGVEVRTHPAEWKKYGHKAGPLRNSEMLTLHPDIKLAVGFPGGRGTHDMMRKVCAAQIPLIGLPWRHT